MKQVEPSKLQENFIDIISKEWLLITAGKKDNFNTMTANWGGMGFLWNKPVAYVFVRPERYTYEFTEKEDYFTLSFLGEENKAVHKICGTKSGRDIDKVQETGLIPIETDLGNITFEQSRLSLECKKLYTDMIKKEYFLDPGVYEQWYNESYGNPHQLYIAEIVNVLVKE